MKEIKIIVEEVFVNADEERRNYEFNHIIKRLVQNEVNKIELKVDSSH